MGNFFRLFPSWCSRQEVSFSSSSESGAEVSQVEDMFGSLFQQGRVLFTPSASHCFADPEVYDISLCLRLKTWKSVMLEFACFGRSPSMSQKVLEEECSGGRKELRQVLQQATGYLAECGEQYSSETGSRRRPGVQGAA